VEAFCSIFRCPDLASELGGAILTTDQATFLRDFLLQRVEEAHIVTMRVLSSIPDSMGEYRPSPKARTARDLARHIIDTELLLLNGIVRGSFERDEHDRHNLPSNLSDLADYYEEQFTAGLDQVRRLTVKKLTTFLSFYGVFRHPAVVYLTFLHDHTVHHRGQLSAYAREVGSKISMLKGRNGDMVTINQPAMKYLWTERQQPSLELANAA
jgi:uncharacterized damage-inducible protein DinB